jgi:chromatin segregation and condensation protein Rec8/ScpA/Scc1 (kleisin family)
MDKENEIEYSVLTKRCYDGRDNDNYPKVYVAEDYLISADSLDSLYEKMAGEYVSWKLEGEKRLKTVSRWSSDPQELDDYFVEFGDIHIIVEEYNENKMKATKTYAEKGKTRDEFLAKQKILEAAKKKAEEERAKKYQEQQEKEQYLRLKKKFEKNP